MNNESLIQTDTHALRANPLLRLHPMIIVIFRHACNVPAYCLHAASPHETSTEQPHNIQTKFDFQDQFGPVLG